MGNLPVNVSAVLMYIGVKCLSSLNKLEKRRKRKAI